MAIEQDKRFYIPSKRTRHADMLPLISWGDMFDLAFKATVCFTLIWMVFGAIGYILFLAVT